MPASPQQILIRELYQSVAAFLLDPSYRAYHIKGLPHAKFQVEAMAQVMAQAAARWVREQQAETIEIIRRHLEDAPNRRRRRPASQDRAKIPADPT
jgi:hypothetical protein